MLLIACNFCLPNLNLRLMAFCFMNPVFESSLNEVKPVVPPVFSKFPHKQLSMLHVNNSLLPFLKPSLQACVVKSGKVV